MITLGELAEHLELPVGDADPSRVLHAIAPLELAGPGDLSFVAEKRYLDALETTRASCVLLKAEWLSQSPVPALCADDPYLSYARATGLFDRESSPVDGVHPSAVVDSTARLGAGVSIGPGASVGAGASLGDAVIVGAGVRIGADVQIGAGTRLHPNAVLYHGVTLGRNCLVHANTAIGSDGFGYARGPSGWEKIHQLGSVEVGDGVEIGAGVAIDRGSLGNTVIASGVIIDNQVHIAHNCRIGERTAIAGCVGFAGSTTIGADCTFAGQVGVSGHLTICDNVHFTGQARVTRSIDEPGVYSSGTPLETQRQWGKNAVRFGQLNEMVLRLKQLEEQVRGAATGDNKDKE